jgi:hypothetical protein
VKRGAVLKLEYILPMKRDNFSGLLSVAGDTYRQHVTYSNIKCDNKGDILSLQDTPSNEGISNELSNYFVLALLHYFDLLSHYTSTVTCEKYKVTAHTDTHCYTRMHISYALNVTIPCSQYLRIQTYSVHIRPSTQLPTHMHLRCTHEITFP